MSLYKFLIFLIVIIQSCYCFLDIEHLRLIFGDKDCIAGSLISLENRQQDNNLKSETNDPLLPLKVREVPSLEKSVLSQLHELAHYHSIGVSYELIKEEGPTHSCTFTINLYLGDETYTAVGKSLKEAKRTAATEAIKNTKFEHPPIKIKENEKIFTPTVLLNNLAAKLGLSVTYSLLNNDILEELQNTDTIIEPRQRKSYLQRLNDSLHLNQSLRLGKDESNIKGPFKVKVMVNGEKFTGIAHTIQNAKHEAASKALKSLKKQKEQDNLYCLKEGGEAKCKQAKQNNKSPISLVYETAQKHHLEVDFDVIAEKGPSHKKSFAIKCTVGEFEATGEGKSKKEAKQIASENMLEKLNNLPVINNKKGKEQKDSSPQESKSQKKRKKKKEKIVKTTLDKIDKYVADFVEFGADVINKFSGNQQPKTNLKSDKRNKHESPTEEIFNLGKMLNLYIQFSDVQDLNAKNKILSILDLGTKPSYICLGEGISQKNSRDLASRNGIKLLQQLGFLEDLLRKSIITESEKYGDEENHRFWLQVIDEETE